MVNRFWGRKEAEAEEDGLLMILANNLEIEKEVKDKIIDNLKHHKFSNKANGNMKEILTLILKSFGLTHDKFLGKIELNINQGGVRKISRFEDNVE